MKKKQEKFLLAVVIFLAAILRLWKLGRVPPSPDWDEAALGYNAYSIMQTGRDEYGKLLPIILRSFDDYKPALYAYLVIPSIKFFGLNTLAVRLPSAVFGILTVLATYFLVIQLFRIKNHKAESKNKKISNLAILTAFLLALSPWHIQFSRIAFEANVGLAFNIFGMLFFLKGLKKIKWFYPSALFYALSFYVYQSEKVFVPLMGILLTAVFRKNLWRKRKQLIFSLMLFVVVIVPFVWATFTTPNALLRAKGVSVFSDQTPFLEKTVQRLIRDNKKGDLLGLVLDNRRVTYAKAFFNGYLSHFDLNWLFITGDHPRHQAPGMGNLYLWELPFLLAGIYHLIFGKFSRETRLLLFGWFIITPLPAALTTGVPHSIRTLNFLPTFQIFTAIGLILFFRRIANSKYKIAKLPVKYLLFAFCFLFFVFNFAYFLNQYFVQQNYFRSKYWQYGYKEAVAQVQKIMDNYEKVVVSNEPHMDQSYIFFLYYLRYDPVKYLEERGTDTGGFAETHKFGKFEFRPLDWDRELKSVDILYVGRPEDFSENANVIKTVNFLDQKPAIKIVKG